jgi:hypothetical protein
MSSTWRWIIVQAAAAAAGVWLGIAIFDAVAG